ncbi:MAG: nucleotide exchange factor GrpE [Alphaproteobacteria bacterium]|nr:nucleotide exchange factor GrpE [Alphaproteobacteria bacterium]
MTDEQNPLNLDADEGLEELFAAAVASVERRMVSHDEESEHEALPEELVDIDVEDEVTFDPGEWGEPPPSEVDKANARAAELETELDLARVRIAQLEESLRERDADLADLKERGARVSARGRRLKEAYDRLRLRADDDREKLTQREAMLGELRASAQNAERDRERNRARVERELDEARRFGNERLLKELLPVIDNLDLAMSHADGDPASTVEGIRMIVSQLDRTLTRVGLQRVESSPGTPFDPQAHEAITYIFHDDVDAGCVVETHQVGYTLHERLLRAARVSVARGQGEAEPAELAPDADDALPTSSGSGEE